MAIVGNELGQILRSESERLASRHEIRKNFAYHFWYLRWYRPYPILKSYISFPKVPASKKVLFVAIDLQVL